MRARAAAQAEKLGQGRRSTTSPAARDAGGLGWNLCAHSRLPPAVVGPMDLRPDRLGLATGSGVRRVTQGNITTFGEGESEPDGAVVSSCWPRREEAGDSVTTCIILGMIGCDGQWDVKSRSVGLFALADKPAERGQHICGRVTAPVGASAPVLRPRFERCNQGGAVYLGGDMLSNIMVLLGHPLRWVPGFFSFF